MSATKEEVDADAKYEDQDDTTGDEVPAGDVQGDPEYVSRNAEEKSTIPVTSDDEPVEDPIDPATANSDETLERDEKLAIQEGEIVEGRTRGATKPAGTYTEPDDEEGLPGPDDGTSSVR